MDSGLILPSWPTSRGRAGGERCGLPAEERSRFTLNSTDGPVDAAMIRCPAGHWFTGPLESLTLATGPGHAALPCLADKGGGRAEWPP